MSHNISAVGRCLSTVQLAFPEGVVKFYFPEYAREIENLLDNRNSIDFNAIYC